MGEAKRSFVGRDIAFLMVWTAVCCFVEYFERYC